MLKTVFLNILKLGITVGLVGWLVRTGKLDFRLIADLFKYPLAGIVAALLYSSNLYFISERWKYLIKARTTSEIPVPGLIRINWIGLFFSSILPGSLSGDLVKVIYLQKLDRNFSKKFIFASILVDRLTGLSGLILMVGASSAFYSAGHLGTTPEMDRLLRINYLLAFLVVAALLLFFRFNPLMRSLLLRIRFLKPLLNFWDYIVQVRRQILKAIAVSVLIQFVAVLYFWILIQPYVGDKMSFLQALAFIPLGLMALALPIAPSGLGVGHAIFQKLFEFAHIPNGASLFNLFFVVTLLVNLLGAIPYVLAKDEDLGRVDV